MPFSGRHLRDRSRLGDDTALRHGLAHILAAFTGQSRGYGTVMATGDMLTAEFGLDNPPDLLTTGIIMAHGNDRAIFPDPRIGPVVMFPIVLHVNGFNKGLPLKPELSLKQLPVTAVLRQRP